MKKALAPESSFPPGLLLSNWCIFYKPRTRHIPDAPGVLHVPERSSAASAQPPHSIATTTQPQHDSGSPVSASKANCTSEKTASSSPVTNCSTTSTTKPTIHSSPHPKASTAALLPSICTTSTILSAGGRFSSLCRACPILCAQGNPTVVVCMTVALTVGLRFFRSSLPQHEAHFCLHARVTAAGHSRSRRNANAALGWLHYQPDAQSLLWRRASVKRDFAAHSQREQQKWNQHQHSPDQNCHCTADAAQRRTPLITGV